MHHTTGNHYGDLVFIGVLCSGSQYAESVLQYPESPFLSHSKDVSAFCYIILSHSVGLYPRIRLGDISLHSMVPRSQEHWHIQHRLSNNDLGINTFMIVDVNTVRLQLKQ